MATAKQVIAIARKEVGTKESPAESNNVKYSRWYPMIGSPWCAMFVSWVLDKAGIDGYKHAYTPSGASLFQSQGRWTQDPRPGDLAYFDFPDSLPRIQHIGIVESVSGDTVVCIEGNTSASDNDNGGVVMLRPRARSLIVGFGRPPYDDADPIARAKDEPSSKGWFSTGDSGADVRIWQRQLNAVMDAEIEVNGKFGADTLAATKQFQKQQGLDVDGEVGPLSLAAMEKVFKEFKRDRPDHPPVLEPFDTGEAVKEAQELLIKLGYDLSPDGADGEFGGKTAKAVAEFNKSCGRKPIEVLSRRGWKALREQVG